MPIHFLCSQCGQRLAIATRKAGTAVNCPRCNATIVVPQQDTTSETAGAVASAGIYFPAIAGAQDTVSSSSVDLDQDSRNLRELADVKGRYLLVSRRVLYLQALLIAVVALIAFGAGYMVGGSRQGRGSSSPVDVTAQ